MGTYHRTTVPIASPIVRSRARARPIVPTPPHDRCVPMRDPLLAGRRHSIQAAAAPKVPGTKAASTPDTRSAERARPPASRVLRFAAALLASLALPLHAFDLEGHRGARGLAPENTMAAFRRAIGIGVATIETDMAVTSDGVIVISHDPFLNPDIVRDADGRWLAAKGPPIHALTLAELRRYDIGRLNPGSSYARQFPEQRSSDGERFPTLA